MLTEADDDVPGVVGHAREEDERAADADDAHEAEHRDAQEQRERDLERVVRLVQREPVPVEHPADVDWMEVEIAGPGARYSVSFQLTYSTGRTRAETEKGLTVEPDHDQEDAHDNRGGDGAAGGVELDLGQAGRKPGGRLRSTHGLPVEIVQ